MARTSFIGMVRRMGYKNYLKSSTDEHNGVGLAMFHVMMRVKTPPYQICNIMNMSRRQVEDLIKVYNEQHKN